jgi:uncharacterized protein
MISSAYTWYHALGGGILIGLATLLGSVATGVPPGISGLLSEILKGQKQEVAWRIVFLLGLVAGALAAFAFFKSASAYQSPRTGVFMIVAGVLVGLGTRISGGCTSGHGVCGLGLGSKRGLAATLIFMAAAMATVYVLGHVVKGSVA